MKNKNKINQLQYLDFLQILFIFLESPRAPGKLKKNHCLGTTGLALLAETKINFQLQVTYKI